MTMLLIGIAAYLAFGGVLAYAMDNSIDFKMPRWLQIPVVVLLWPLAVFLLFYAFMSWIAGGSH